MTVRFVTGAVILLSLYGDCQCVRAPSSGVLVLNAQPISFDARSSTSDHRQRTASDPAIDLEQYDSTQFGKGEDATGRTDSSGVEVPAIKGVATHVFFEYASQVAVDLMKLNFKKVSLPPLETYVDIPVLGTFRLNLDNISLDDLDVNDTHSGIFLGGDGTLLLTVTDLNAVVNGDFHFQRMGGFPPVPIGGGGHITIRATKGRAVFQVLVVDHGDGRAFVMARAPAQVSFQGIRVQISNIPLKFLFNFIAAIAASPIQDAITQQVANQVTVRVPEAANILLAGIPNVVQLGDLNLNISLASMPLVTSDNVTLYDWGRFQDPDPEHPQDCPYRMQPAGFVPPPAGEEGRMLVADVDESLANCLTWALFERGDLDRYVEGEGLPGLGLATDTWALVVPGLAEKYPHQWMGLQVHIAEPPVSHIRAGTGVVTHGNATLSFYLQKPSRSLAASSAVDPTLGGTLARAETLKAGQKLLGTATLNSNAVPRHSDGSLNSGERIDSQGRKNPDGSVDPGEPASSWGSRNPDGSVNSSHRGPMGSFLGKRNPEGSLQERGEHLFTLDLAAQLVATNPKFVPASEEQPDTFRLAVDMHIVDGSLWHKVVESSVGPIDESRLQLLISLVGFLVEREVNGDILAHLLLPDVAHIKLVDPIITVNNGSVRVLSDVKYV